GGPRRLDGDRARQPTPPGRVSVPMPGPLPVELPTPSRERSPRQSEIFQPTAPVPSPFPDPYSQPSQAPAPAPARVPAGRVSPRQLFNFPVASPFALRQVRQRNGRQRRREEP